MIRYNWTQGGTGTEDALTVTMPATAGQSIDVAVSVDDEANLGNGAGTRDDAATVLTMKLYAAYPDPNDPDPDGDGKPNSQDEDDDGDGTPDAQDPDSQITPTPTPPPDPAPSDNSVSLTADGERWHSIDLSWSQFEGESFSSYKLYRSTQEGFVPDEQTNYIGRGATLENTVAQLRYTDTGLAPGTTYYYVLRVTHGGQTSDASAQAETVDLPTPNVTFSRDQLARACAGGIAGDDVHTFTITGTAKRLNENGGEELVPEDTEFKLSFENNRGHDYDNGSAPRKAKFVTTNANGDPDYVEELTVQADDQGKINFTVLSSDIISSDIEVKVKWEDADGEEQDAGSKACEFVKVESKRRYGIVFADQGAADDRGWYFDSGLFDGPGSYVPGVYKIKFWRDPSITPDDKYFTIPGANPGDDPIPVSSVENPNEGEDDPYEIPGSYPRFPLDDALNWIGVSGHKIEIRISEIQPHESVSLSSSEVSDYAYFVDHQNFVLNADGQRALDGNGQPFTDPSAVAGFTPVTSITLDTDASGGAMFYIGAGSRIDEAKKVLLEAENKTQH